MKENKPIAKGIFKREKTELFKNVVLIITVLFFAQLFFSLGNKYIKSGNASFAVFWFTTCLFGVAFCVILAIKECFFMLYFVELYENEMKFKNSVFKEKIICYNEMVKVDTIQDGLMITTKQKCYCIPYLKNNFEIFRFIDVRIREKKRNPTFNLENEEKNYKDKKSDFRLKIIIECGIFLLMVVAIFVCMGMTGCRDTVDFTDLDKKIFSVFLCVEAVLGFSLFAYTVVIVKARFAYEDAKQRYSDALSFALINSGINENVLRIFRTWDNGRILVYWDAYMKAYKCSHQMFIFKSKSWYTYMLSDSFQLLEEIDEYLEDFKCDIVDF